MIAIFMTVRLPAQIYFARSYTSSAAIGGPQVRDIAAIRALSGWWHQRRRDTNRNGSPTDNFHDIRNRSYMAAWLEFRLGFVWPAHRVAAADVGSGESGPAIGNFHL
jgi:hypothetical protein